VAFFDAIAPICAQGFHRHVAAWFQSRYDKMGPVAPAPIISLSPSPKSNTTFRRRADCREKTDFKEWETNTPYFDGCPAIEVLPSAAAKRCVTGDEPVGLTNPHDPTVKPTPSCSYARTTARHALQHGRLSRPS